MGTFVYGACTDGDVDLVDLSMPMMELFVKTLAGYAVDFLPWRKLMCVACSRNI